MTSSLFSALSGMRAHQQWIDVIGNNLSNSNTAGYKSTRASFSAAMSQTLSYATSPSSGGGGTNPSQIGLGVTHVNTQRIFNQGSLNTTGRVLDLALEGGGYFSVSNGNENFYTRAGAFGLDANSNLVDLVTGYKVKDSTGSSIALDVDSLFPPQATSNVTVKGNLPGVVTGPLTEELTSINVFKEGTPANITSTVAGPIISGLTPNASYSMELKANGGAPQVITITADAGGNIDLNDVATSISAIPGVTATVVGGVLDVVTDISGANATLKFTSGSPNDLAGAIGMPTALASGTETPVNASSELNDLTANLSDYVPGDIITISGVDTDGTPINANFVYGAGNDGTTLQELVDFVDAQYTDATVSMNSSGQLVVKASTAGESDLLLSISDDAASTGSTSWTTHSLSVTEEGTGPDEVVVTSEVFDASGVARTLTITMQRQGDLSWNLYASLPDGQGTVLTGDENNPLTGLLFDENGAPTSLGGVPKDITVQFPGTNSPQTITLDLGTDGNFEGVTQFGSQQNIAVDVQDGFSDGSLANLSVDATGQIVGFYTNGQARSLGDIGIASFNNDEGLEAVGENLFRASVNSGDAKFGVGGVLGRGSVVSGALEGSNVDTVEEFVHLIEAQRGFQANARVISTVDEVLAELANII
ncbi:MAG: flagellar hook-basal body complex protein [Planctomycetes bacterium]|nr:flagellar hook-basal body complex protein [Planctomycetota bacterium]